MGSMTGPIRYTAFKGSKTGEVQKVELEKEGLGRHEVLLQLLYSGVCGTDEHYKHSEIVLGYEGVGIVKEVGLDVRSLKLGDRVGMGYVRGGCGYCPDCLTGYNWFCTNDPNNYGAQHIDTATWSSHAVVPAMRLAKIPEGIASEFAGPLMCAGQTVWLPLARTDVRAWHTVGVVGVGGLGHLAIQFAAKMGCRVVVFSGTTSKKDEAMRLGATDFYTAAELRDDKVPKAFINHLLVTTSQLPDWSLYAPLMANQSHIFPLTISMDDFKINTMTLVGKEISVHGLCASTMMQVNQMLEFAARHSIKPMVEEYPMTERGVAEALVKLEKGELRYRAVLKVQ